MVLENALAGLVATIADLIEKRRAAWPDSAGRELERTVLVPISDAIDELQRISKDYERELQEAFAELDRG